MATVGTTYYYVIVTKPNGGFSKPRFAPFDYLRANGEVMSIVEQKAWNFDPTEMGFVWDEGTKYDYQRHFPEGYGYAVLRPVKKI